MYRGDGILPRRETYVELHQHPLTCRAASAQEEEKSGHSEDPPGQVRLPQSGGGCA